MNITMISFSEYLLEQPTKRIGKEIGGSVYLHHTYVANHPRIPQEEYDKAVGILKEKHPNHNFNIVRYGYTGADKGSFSFINSPDFDTSPEPISGDSVRINVDGSTKLTKQKNDPQIYHHKHEWVDDNYTGFDVQKSKERSAYYNPIIDKIKETNPKIRSRMGTLSVWKKEVLPHLNEQLLFVYEEYDSLINNPINRTKHPVFVNPTKDEIRELSQGTNNARFIAHNNKFYLFNGSVLHAHAIKQLNLPIGSEPHISQAFLGIAKPNANGTLTFSDTNQKNIDPNIIKDKYQYINKYFN